ncbi:MAG TPA: serine--tRNA ligase [Chthoniobacterales bacterium]|nr:serine--tRNA ligase [Chthoniobacterales bacterium]
MLEMRLLREKPDYVRERLTTRNPELSLLVDKVLKVDSERRRLETELQRLSAERNQLSKEVGILRSKKESSAEEESKVRAIAEEIARLNEAVAAVDESQRKVMLGIPNLPHPGAPIGANADSNPEVRVWGEKPGFNFQPIDHVELNTRLGLFDPVRAAKISGAGYVCFTNLGARLQRGLIQFLLDLHTSQHGYVEICPPYIVRRECMVGTGQLPKFEGDAYGLEDGQAFLIPTAEVPLTNLHRGEILSHAELPKYFVAQTPCFRREAGSAGRDTRGIIRVHQFDKVELVKITTPETSYEEHEKLTADAEKVLRLLGLHYRVIELCTGDLGLSMAKTYDLEVWAPGMDRYLEVSSCSNAEDYQARRMNLKFKDKDGKNRFCHTLNGSGTALPRLWVALVETYQQADGSIRIPGPLVDYVGVEEIR